MLYTNYFANNKPSLKLLMSLLFSFLFGFQFAFSQCPDPTPLPMIVCQNSVLDFSDYLDENVDGIWHLISNPSGDVDPPVPYPSSFNTTGSPQGVYEFEYIPNEQALVLSCAPLPTYAVQVLPDADPAIIIQQDVFCETAVVDLDTIVLIGASNINTEWFIISGGVEISVDDITNDNSHVWDFGAFAVSGNSLTFKVVVNVNGTTCTSELEFTVSLSDVDVTDFSYPDTFCENDVYDPTLGAMSSPNGTFSFVASTPPNAGASINSSTGRISGLEEGFYTVIYATSGGCANSTSENIQVTRNTVITVQDTAVCSGDDLNLLTDIITLDNNGTWVTFPGMNTLPTTSFTNILSDIQFFYQVDVPGICITGDTLDITVINETSIAFSNTICNNDNTFDVDVEIGNIGQNYPITIDPPVNGFSTDIDGGTLTTLNLPNNTYTITVTDTTMGVNCVTVSNSFTNSCGCPEGLTAMADETLCSGETIALTATLDVGPLSGVDLTWAHSDGVIADPDNYIVPSVSGCDSVEYVITVTATCIDDNSEIINTDNTLILTVHPPILPPTLNQVADPLVDCKYEIATACTNYIVEDDNGNPISSIDLDENDPAGTIDLVITEASNVCQSWSGTLNYDECTACLEENFTTFVNLDVDTELNLEDFLNEEIAGSYACKTCPTASVFNGTAAVDFASGDLGEYIFSYTFDSPKIGCPDAQYLTVNVVDNSSINAESVIYICSDVDRIIDLEDYLTSTKPASFWLETSPTPSSGTAFDPAVGTFNTATQTDGSYQFAYVTTGSTDTTFLDIILIAAQNYEPIDVDYDRYVCPDSETVITVDGYSNATFSWYSEITPPDSVEITTGISGAFNETLSPDLTPGSYFLSVIQEVGGCKSAPRQFAITFFDQLDPAGNFSILHTDSTVCVGNFLDLAGFATSNTGGTFNYYSEDISTANAISSVVTITTDTTFIIEHEAEYTIGATSQFCIDSFIVNIVTPVAITLVVDSDLKSVCNVATTDVTTLDFTAFVNDQSGSWSAPNAQENVDFTDLTAIDFNGLMADTLTFFYTINGGGSCLPVTDTLTVEVKECTCPNVGTVSPTEDVCRGSSFDLNVLLDNADQSGTGSWSIVNQVDNTQPAAVDNDSIFNSTGAALGNYTIQFTNINAPLANCPDSSIQIITVSAGELAGTGRDTTLCANIASHDLNINISDANVGGTWSADPANSSNGTIDPSGEIFPNTMDENGNYLYYFTVSNNSCKDDTARVEVNIISQATAMVATQSNACNEVGNVTILNFSDFITAGDTTGIWTDVNGAGVDLSDIKNVNFESITTGVYTFNYSLANNPCGGANYDVSITVDDANCADCLNYDIRPLDDLCSVGGQRILNNKLTVNSIITELPGSWSIEPDPTKQNPPIIRADTVDNAYVFIVDNSDAGEYTLVFSLDTIQPAACDTFKKAIINVVDPPNAGNSYELAICNTEDEITDLFAELQDADTGGKWLQLSGPDPGENLDTVGAFNFLSLNAPRGNYVYQYSIEGTGCPVPSTSEVVLNVDGEYDFDVLSNITICETISDSLYFDLNSLITINDTGVFNIEGDWDDLDFINAGNTIVNFNIVASGNYSFEFTPRSDCNAQSYYVDITLEECYNSVFVPSAFSPNNDGLNDFLDLFGSNIQSVDFKVFNRWGQMMFESNQLKTNWDGLFNKVASPIGVYTYFVKVVYEDGQIEEKVGDVTLIR